MQLVFYGSELLFTEALSALLVRRNYQMIVQPTSAEELLSVTKGGADAYLVDVVSFAESNLVDRLRVLHPKEPIIAIIPENDAALLTSSLEAGVTGVCLKSDDIEEIERVLVQSTLSRRFHATGPYLSVEARAARRRSLSPKGQELTPKERAVLDLLIVGTGTRGIAAGLGVTEATVRTHLQHLFAKFGVHSRIALIAAAVSTYRSRTDSPALAFR